MLIGGLLKFSLIDHPGKVAAVIFTQGCNYRCPFCHNPELVLPELFHAALDQGGVCDFLQKRRGQLQSVVVTGGEPTLQPDLADFLGWVKKLGFLVKLDSNGSRPEVLRNLFERGLVDYIAMDVKSSGLNYGRAAGVPVDLDAITASIGLIRRSGVEHEFRTTALKGIVSLEDLRKIADLIGPGQTYNLQRGSLKGKIIDYNFFADSADYSDEEWTCMKNFYPKGEK